MVFPTVDRPSLEQLKERYQAKCDEVFKDLQSDKEFKCDLETKGFFRFNKYEMKDVEYNQSQAAISAIEFITGLRQYRENQSKKETTHSEQEVLEAFQKEFEDKMVLDQPMNDSSAKQSDKKGETLVDQEEEVVNMESFRPKFISKAGRKTKAYSKQEDIDMKEIKKAIQEVHLDLNENEDVKT